MDLKNKKILVIGGAGFIGSHVVDQLLKEPVKEVIVYDNFCRGSKENLKAALQDPRVNLFSEKADILDMDQLADAIHGVDGVFHLAALWLLECYERPRDAFEVNIRGTFHVIDAAMKANVKRVVYSSSASVYGNALQTPMTEEHAFNNETFYGATKIAGEQMFKSLGKQHDSRWVGLRYMNVYGPRQDYKGAYTAVMHKILDRIEEGQQPIIYGDGKQEYDFIDVRDTARANVLAMRSDVSGECYNVGRGVGTTIQELTELLLRLCQSDLKIEYKPQGQSFVTKRIGCPKKARKDLGFNWSIDLEKGMRDLITWRASR